MTKLQLAKNGALAAAALLYSAHAGCVEAVHGAETPRANAGALSAQQAASYSLGLTFGGQLHHGGITDELSMDALMRGVQDGLHGKAVSAEDKQRVAMMLRSAKELVGAGNKEAARAFLAKNAKLPGVTTTPSGLQYKVLAPGDPHAAAPKSTDQVTVQYRGRLLNGMEFDNSAMHGQAASFRVNSVIKGWQEALPLMKPGAKWELFVPPELAYDLNSPSTIPPGSLLVFDIELIKVTPPPKLDDPSLRQSLKAATPQS
jgi:FKBP-type peptidyl-prolyl cis-trans isomerase